MTPELLAATAGALLSLAVNYIPGLSTKFDTLSSNGQRLMMAGLLAIAAVGTAIWTCTDPERGGVGICLGGTDWRAIIQAYVFALMANQATDRISPKAGASNPSRTENQNKVVYPPSSSRRSSQGL